jgi:hypothetical protein
VLDACGNAVATVSEIESILEDPEPAAAEGKSAPKKRQQSQARGTLLILHDAVVIKHVRELIR